MWSRIASILLRYRFAVLLVLGGITFYMGSKIPNLRMVYEFGGLLPKDDPTRLEFENFIEHFGAEGNIMVLGVEDPKVYTAEGFQSWYELAEEIREVNVQVNGVETQIIDSVFCISHAFTVEKDTAKRAFKVAPLASDLTRGGPSLTQETVDSIVQKVRSLEFFDGVLYTDSSDATLMMVFLDSKLFNSKDRGTVIGM